MQKTKKMGMLYENAKNNVLEKLGESGFKQVETILNKFRVQNMGFGFDAIQANIKLKAIAKADKIMLQESLNEIKI